MSWPLVTLPTICRPKQWPTIPKKELLASGHPVFGANGQIGYYSDYNHEEPTILITCRGATCGTINVCEPKSYVTGNAMALDDLDQDQANLNFVVRALEDADFGSVITGVAQPQITRQSLARLKIPLPPLAEQKRIAAILDAADALRTKRRESLAQLDSLLQSTFLEMFGDPVTNPMRWEVVQLGELGSEKGAIVDGPFGSAISVKEDYSDDGDVPVVRTKNVSPFEFVTNDLKFITEEKFRTISRSEVLPGDIILTKVGTIGHVCFFPKRFAKGVLSTTGSCRIRPDLSKVNPIYLARYLHAFRPQMLAIAATGVQPFLNMKHIRGFSVFLPPLDLQHRFASIVESVEAQKATQREHLEELDTLFAALQQRAFNGELSA